MQKHEPILSYISQKKCNRIILSTIYLNLVDSVRGAHRVVWVVVVVLVNCTETIDTTIRTTWNIVVVVVSYCGNCCLGGAVVIVASNANIIISIIVDVISKSGVATNNYNVVTNNWRTGCHRVVVRGIINDHCVGSGAFH